MRIAALLLLLAFSASAAGVWLLAQTLGARGTALVAAGTVLLLAALACAAWLALRG